MWKNIIILIIFSISGFAALIYEVLWLKELGLLFGNTAHAAATTFAIFFMGLAAGGYFWGKRAPRVINPLRKYAVLELSIAITALLYFIIFDLYYVIYPFFFNHFANQKSVFVLIKFLLATGLLFLPAFFMGGTFPIMGQYVIRDRGLLGKSGSLLYSVNVLGAALGAFAAGFFLPRILGYNGSYILAILINTSIAIVIFFLSFVIGYKYKFNSFNDNLEKSYDFHNLDLKPKTILLISFFSGFATLGLEILWTRMFAQALINSVYTFSAILVTFLVALSIGSGFANLLCRAKFNPRSILSSLLLLSGLFAAISPLAFYLWTGDSMYITSKGGWLGHVCSIFKFSVGVIFLPSICLGTVFPYLFKVSQGMEESAGETIGRLTAANTIGAILGALCSGFLMLGTFGLWDSIYIISIMYLLVAVLVSWPKGIKHRGLLLIRSLALVCLAGLVSMAVFESIPKVVLEKEEILLELWEGSHSTVAALKKGDDLLLKVNSHYTLGNTSNFQEEQRQAHIPLILHPNPKTVFFIGLGTGITAGGALDFPVEKVVVSELIPEVITAAEKHFTPFVNGLFTDSRVDIIAEDGRNFLLGTSQKYDVIISDLFLPWEAGTGNLYTQEHFQTVRSRLEKDGIFAQWFPPYLVSKAEFSIIIHSMIKVFPQVTLWRLSQDPKNPLVVLIGHKNPGMYYPENIRKNICRVLKCRTPKTGLSSEDLLPYMLYAGDLTEAKALFESYPLNRDNFPLIEYLVPITHEKVRAGTAHFLKDLGLLKFFDDVFAHSSPENDKSFFRLTRAQTGYIRGGLNHYKARNYLELGDYYSAKLAYLKYLSDIPLDLIPQLRSPSHRFFQKPFAGRRGRR